MSEFDSSQWDIQSKAHRFEEYLGQPSLFLQEGTALLTEVEFLDGIIEYDVAFGPQRGFAGVLWRTEDHENYEDFYMRPHQSGNPDAMQYTPVYKELAGWQLYSGTGYAGVAEYPFDTWIHVKLVVSGTQAEIYIDNSEEPALFMHQLMRDNNSGGVGLKSGPLTSAHFANFQVVPMDSPPQLKGSMPQLDPHPTNLIPEWNVSNPFPESMLAELLHITDEIKDELTWEITVADDSGLVNLSKVNRWSPKRDTAIAQCTILSEHEQFKQLQFGFSDKIKIYFNDQLLFAGNDVAYSRDYRFLGTIGYYNELCLPLKAGENELWLAVTEGFPPGGWGLQARFPDMAGITLR